MRRILCLLTALFVAGSLCAQPEALFRKDYYTLPLDLYPISLSGTTAEFRANHFHSGTDFRTQATVGYPVYAVANGYISRISISPTGYGNALYVTHPNGTTSVYGHLLRFMPEVAAWVEDVQYERKSWNLDTTLVASQFPVVQGQVMAYSGNSGDSGGPHLHFEIRYRDASVGPGDITANIQRYGIYEVADSQPPQLRRVQFYHFSTSANGVPQPRLLKEFFASGEGSQPPVAVADSFYVAIDAVDRMDNTSYTYAIQRWEVYLDGLLVYAYQNRDYPLALTRYVNALIQYPMRALYRNSMLKTWVEPGNRLTDFIEAPTDGVFSLPDSLPHQLTVAVYDAGERRTQWHFMVQKTLSRPSIPTPAHPFYYATDNYFVADSFQVKVPRGALYKNIDFSAQPLPENQWRVHTSQEPLHRPMTLQWRLPDTIPPQWHDKVVLMYLNDNARDAHIQAADPRKWSYAGGRVVQGTLTARVNSFGVYSLAVDTLAPQITSSLSNGASLMEDTLSFYVIDALSGVDRYEVLLDGAWYLFAYDYKTHRLTATLDSKRLAKGTSHLAEVTVTDACGNRAQMTLTFYW